MGASLGAASLGALYTSRLEGTLQDRLGAAEAGRILSGGELTADAVQHFPAGAGDAVRAAVTSGVHAIAIVGAALGAVAFGLAWLVRETPLRESPAPTPVLEETHV
ncbi:hypothetical protein [Micromonospora sp. WMMD812]|uniref:hypothetical protein n=1 Tax=Micromonospora sp. WMMD812 TaxID=3015152 RepID=UPI00248B7CFC|nr:hypothetical protein [Micromonospora sp. WMMD812]WBB65907.1 hypothetical protein O7603_22345 [Micromonospora sp. WMMD812]